MIIHLITSVKNRKWFSMSLFLFYLFHCFEFFDPKDKWNNIVFVFLCLTYFT